MPNRERRKGRDGEREVATIFEAAGLTVRGLEGSGDHLIVCDPGGHLVVHSEVKRQEVTRPWEWYRQATDEAPAGAIAAVTFRRSRSPWLTLLAAERFARLLAGAGGLKQARLIEIGNRLADELEPIAAAGIGAGSEALPALLAEWDAETGGR